MRGLVIQGAHLVSLLDMWPAGAARWLVAAHDCRRSDQIKRKISRTILMGIGRDLSAVILWAAASGVADWTVGLAQVGGSKATVANVTRRVALPGSGRWTR